MTRAAFIEHWDTTFREEALPDLQLVPYGTDGVMLYDGRLLVRTWGNVALHGIASFLAGFILGRKTRGAPAPPSSP